MRVKGTSPTLLDVAAKSGVSTATVSRALNFPDTVAESTRRKVMAAVRDLGYSPNFGARAMASRRTNTIGAIIPTMENAIFARGLQAFQDELRDHGFTLLVASSSYKPDQEEEQIRALVARGADGLLLIGHDRDDRIYRFLEAQGVPALVTWALDRSVRQPSVGFDNRRAMQGLTRNVLSLGHRRLAVITANIAFNDRARARVQGVRDALAEVGLGDKPLPIVETPYSIDNGAQALKELMLLPVRPTAVLCANDVLAVGALRGARELGIAVPGALSVTGFDDIELAQVAIPELTTVHVPHLEMGRQAAITLVQLVRGEGFVETIELVAETRLRASLAAPPE